VALFLLHPAEHAIDFAGMMKEEVTNRAMSGLIHGGFVAILGIQLACFAIFSGRLGWQRSLVIAAITFYALGSVFRGMGILANGILIPAMAVHYADASAATIESLRGSVYLVAMIDQWFGFAGSAFQAAGILAWGAALFAVSRTTGVLAVVIGGAMAASLIVSLIGSPMLAMLSIAGLILWALVAGLALVVRAV
jgi:hypothetical protein